MLSFLVTWVVIQNSCGVQLHQCQNNLESILDVKYGYMKIILGYEFLVDILIEELEYRKGVWLFVVALKNINQSTNHILLISD